MMHKMSVCTKSCMYKSQNIFFCYTFTTAHSNLFPVNFVLVMLLLIKGTIHLLCSSVFLYKLGFSCTSHPETSFPGSLEK